MNTLDIINNQLDDIELARLDDPTEAELSMMVSRWEQKEMIRLGIK